MGSDPNANADPNANPNADPGALGTVGKYVSQDKLDEIAEKYAPPPPPPPPITNGMPPLPQIAPPKKIVRGLNVQVKSACELKCWRETNSSAPDGISVKVKYLYNAYALKGGLKSRDISDRYIMKHEMGHSDYFWGELVLPLYNMVKRYNKSKIEKWTFSKLESTEIAGVVIPLSKFKCCSDIKKYLNENLSSLEGVAEEKNHGHDSWKFYGRGTSETIH